MTITNKLIHSSLWQTQNKMSVRKFSIDSPCLIDDLIRSLLHRPTLIHYHKGGQNNLEFLRILHHHHVTDQKDTKHVIHRKGINDS